MCLGDQAPTAVAKLIGLIVVMASCLPPEARIAIADQLKQEADALAPPFDRRALH